MAAWVAASAKSSYSRSVRADRAGRHRQLNASALARAVIAALLGAYIAWWVVKIGAADALADTRPGVAATVAPNNPRVRISLAMAYFEAQGGRVPDQFRSAALDAVKQAPLADEPFLLAAVDALARGDNARGDRLLEEARRRNPRLRLARLLLLDRYLREGRIPEAVVEIKALDNLVEGAGKALTMALAQMTQDPKTAPQMLPLLRRLPALQEPVLEGLVTSGASESAVLNVAGAAAHSGGSEPWKAALLSRMVSKGDVTGAWSLWKSFTGFQEGAGGKGVYDPTFAGLAGPPPFNWKLTTEGIGVAERSHKHSLQVDYYGRDNGDLATQLLLLRPGRYRLSVKASGDAAGEGSRLVWTVACAGNDNGLLQLPLTGVTPAAKGFEGVFTIPATGCATQWLKLTGVSGDVATNQSATITNVSIEPEQGG